MGTNFIWFFRNEIKTFQNNRDPWKKVELSKTLRKARDFFDGGTEKQRNSSGKELQKAGKEFSCSKF
jgi:hypothetical protein